MTTTKSAYPVRHSRADAERFIEALTGSKGSTITFQTFSEGGPSDSLPTILHGTIGEHWDELLRLNEAGHGIFVMVNEGDGRGRRAENVVTLRALFTDDDGKGPMPKPTTDAAPPTMVVESAHGQHTYWTLQPGEPLSAFTMAQAAVAKHFGTDPKVKDLPRVMRVPGFFHQKDREHPFLVTVKEVRSVRYTIQQVLTAFPTVEAANEPMRERTTPSTTADSSMAVRRARAYLSKVPGAVQGSQGDHHTYCVACVLVRDFELPREEALVVFRGWNERCVPPWSDEDLVAKLDRAEKYGTGDYGAKLDGDPTHFAGTEDLCFVVPLASYFLRLPTGHWNLAAPLTKDAARHHLRALGVREKPASNILGFGLMPLVHSIDCTPGESPVFTRDGILVVNSYRASRVVPAPGDFPRLRAIMEAVTDYDADGYAWLFNWMAAKYQNPGERSLTAPVFQGAQGIGKTMLGIIFAKLLGEENTACISQADIDSQFNGHYVTKLLVIADEVVNQDNIKDTASVLKKYVTDPRIQVNVKNVPQYEASNRMSWWFTSNAMTPVRVEGPHDRRYTVFASFTPPSAEYRALTASIHSTGGGFTPEFQREMAAFAHALAHHTVDGALARTPLRNAARDALIDASRSSSELFLAEVEEHGVIAVVTEYYCSNNSGPPRWDFRDDGVAVDAVYAAYRKYCESCGMAACKRQKMGHDIKVAFSNAVRTRVSIDGKRVRVYRGLPREGRSK
jgi:hypothetical protein